MSDKIKPHHIGRKAILYVCQSSTFQVQNNVESQKLQYAIRDRLCGLGRTAAKLSVERSRALVGSIGGH
jgi:hypothetical protein